MGTYRGTTCIESLNDTTLHCQFGMAGTSSPRSQADFAESCASRRSVIRWRSHARREALADKHNGNPLSPFAVRPPSP